MSAAVTSSPALGARPRPTVAFWSVFSWLVLQVLALGAAGLRVPFSARFPGPEEQLAMHEMLLVQLVASAMLFPILMQCFSTAALVIASAPVMMLLAGLLAEIGEAGPLMLACLYPVVWLLGLAMWAYVLRTPKSQLYGIACAVLLVLGGALLAYLNREFGAPTQSFDWQRRAHLGPLMGGIALLEGGKVTGTIWIFLGSYFVLSAIASVLTLIQRRKVARNG